MHPSILHYLLIFFLNLQKESASQYLLDILGHMFNNFDDIYLHKKYVHVIPRIFSIFYNLTKYIHDAVSYLCVVVDLFVRMSYVMCVCSVSHEYTYEQMLQSIQMEGFIKNKQTVEHKIPAVGSLSA